jgi:hypothetical protein
MASSYDNDLRLEEQASGENSTSWGDKTNNNLELIAEAFGYATEAITTNADTHSTVIANGSTDPGRAMVLKYTGTLDSTCTITISQENSGSTVYTTSKLWYIQNATSGSQDIVIASGSGANVTIANGQTKCIYTDGAGSGGAVIDTFAALSAVDLFVDDDLTLQSDGAVINFGADSDVSLTHNADSGLTLSAGANATQLNLTSTNDGDTAAPTIALIRDSASPANDDQLGYLNFVGDDAPTDGSTASQHSYAQIYAVITDITYTEEDSWLYINTMAAGSAANNLIVKNNSVSFKVGNTVTHNQGFAENTKMVFYQSSAPTGWTIDDTQNNKALRVVSSSGGNTGGSVAFTTAFASKSVTGSIGGNTANHQLDITEIPAHTHTVSYASNDATGVARNGSGGASGTFTSGSAGGGGSHRHGASGLTFSGTAINLAVQYCDVMICVKGA